MPNYCSNYLNVSGKVKDIERFDTQFKKKHWEFSGASGSCLKTDNLEVFVLFMEGIPYKVLANDLDYNEYTEQISKYFYGTIPEDEIVYKTPNNAEQLLKKINSKNYTVMIIGQESCHYCDLYKNVFNEEIDFLEYRKET